MEKLHGAANRINKGLQHRLSEMAKFGQSRHQAKEDSKKAFLAAHGNLKGWNPGLTPGIFSIKTMEAYRQTATEFSRWAASQGVKNASQITRELAAQYLQSRQAAGLSAWSYSKDMSALNKVYNFDFTKKELGLQARHRADITRSREKTANDRRDLSAYKDHMTFAKGCGCRRESIDPNSIGKHVTPSDCLRNAEGKVVAIYLTEKGGKSRFAPILNAFKEELTRIVDARMAEPDKLNTTARI